MVTKAFLCWEEFWLERQVVIVLRAEPVDSCKQRAVLEGENGIFGQNDTCSSKST